MGHTIFIATGRSAIIIVHIIAQEREDKKSTYQRSQVVICTAGIRTQATCPQGLHS